MSFNAIEECAFRVKPTKTKKRANRLKFVVKRMSVKQFNNGIAKNIHFCSKCSKSRTSISSNTNIKKSWSLSLAKWAEKKKIKFNVKIMENSQTKSNAITAACNSLYCLINSVFKQFLCYGKNSIKRKRFNRRKEMTTINMMHNSKLEKIHCSIMSLQTAWW